MDVFPCKTPELIRKEIWMHVLAYNLINTVMAQATSQNGVSAAIDQLRGNAPDPRSVSTADREPGAPRPQLRRCSERSLRMASPTDPIGLSPAWPNAGRRTMTA